MKITIYELLELINEGKAPNKIHHQYYDYRWSDIDNDYQKNSGEMLLGNMKIQYHLNDEIEIIEEEKDIEELDIDNYRLKGEEFYYKMRVIDKTLADKINELIKAVNELKKEGK